MLSYISRSTVIQKSLTYYSSEKLVEAVGTIVTLLENVMADLAHFISVQQHITAAIKTSVYFDWIKSTGFSVHYQELVDGIASSVARISMPLWCKRRNRLVTEAVRQTVTKRKMTIPLHQSVSNKAMALTFFLATEMAYSRCMISVNSSGTLHTIHMTQAMVSANGYFDISC
jgi:hypothetical protein